jgi:hypothetical protein
VIGERSPRRPGFGVTRKQTLSKFSRLILALAAREVRDGEDAIANTRDASAPQKFAAKIQVSILLPNISWIFLDKIAALN